MNSLDIIYNVTFPCNPRFYPRFSRFSEWLRGDGYHALGLREKQFLIANLESWATTSISNLTSYIDVNLKIWYEISHGYHIDSDNPSFHTEKSQMSNRIGSFWLDTKS